MVVTSFLFKSYFCHIDETTFGRWLGIGVRCYCTINLQAERGTVLG